MTRKKFVLPSNTPKWLRIALPASLLWCHNKVELFSFINNLSSFPWIGPEPSNGIDLIHLLSTVANHSSIIKVNFLNRWVFLKTSLKYSFLLFGWFQCSESCISVLFVHCVWIVHRIYVSLWFLPISFIYSCSQIYQWAAGWPKVNQLNPELRFSVPGDCFTKSFSFIISRMTISNFQATETNGLCYESLTISS